MPRRARARTESWHRQSQVQDGRSNVDQLLATVRVEYVQTPGPVCVHLDLRASAPDFPWVAVVQ